MRRSIDLNSDLGEGAGTEPALMPLISSANVACGAHAGDERAMRQAVALAIEHGVSVGAHPGYPDRERFGRVALELAENELIASLCAQIETLAAVASRAGTRLTHVKAHGALYNQAERDATVARTIVAALRSTNTASDLVVFAPPGSAMHAEAERAGLRIAREGFIDRAYEPDGTLRSRQLTGALLTDPVAASRQALSFVKDGGVVASDGTFLELDVDTLCVHGDTPRAPEIARAVRDAFGTAGVEVVAFRT